MKKIIAVALCLLITVSLSVCTCGAAESADGGRTGHITIWYWGNEVMQQVVDGYMAENPGVTFDLVEVKAEDYLQKYITAYASQMELPDIGCLEVAYRARLIDVENAWMDLEALGLDRNEMLDYMLPFQMNSKGEIVGIEMSVSVGAFAYKRDLAKQYFGTDDPAELEEMFKTWDDVLAKAAEVYEKSNGETYIFSSWGDLYEILRNQYAKEIFDEKGAYNKDAIAELITTVKNFKDGNAFDKKIQSWSTDWYALFPSDKCIFYECASWAPQYVIKPSDPEGSGNWGVMRAPGGSYTAGGTSLMVSTSSDCPETCFDFLKWGFLSGAGTDIQRACGELTASKQYFVKENFGEPDPFFNGQPIFETFVDVAQDPEFVPLALSVYDPSFKSAMNAMFEEMMSSDLTAEQGIENVCAELDSMIPMVNMELGIG